ncbi:phosphoribosylglycinamide synthetase [Apiospora kogelbergensis]|uniref:phosphoribosylglycinamide synthetase n=1 Tax=Apiospora kogelbergensis TaxID=1337665 RepID=UPI00313231D9
MRRHGIPTAEGESFEHYSEARKFIKDSERQRFVIKALGLAAGKGVVLAADQKEALEALDDIMVYKKFGREAGDHVVVEELLDGEEISVHTFCDAHTHKTLAAGQDHKRTWEPDGPNTGWMGAYTPVDFLSEEDMKVIEHKIIKPTLGLLFICIMMTKHGPKVIEYKARFGDPETQSMLPHLSSDTDLCQILLACTSNALESVKIKARSGHACNVVVASGGYPGSAVQSSWRRALKVSVLRALVDPISVHGVLKTAGGRVFSVAAVEDTLEEAVRTAYKGVKLIKFDGM